MEKAAGRYNGEAGIERVDHDGLTHVVKPKDVEVSQRERMEWYYRGRPPAEDRLVHKITRFQTQYDHGGNPMWVNESHRTSLPRPHQWNMERRLQEQREPGSSYDVKSSATRAQATAKAFVRVSAIVIASGVLDNKKVAAISSDTGLPVEEVLSLAKIAANNPDLAKQYAGIPGVAEPDKPAAQIEKVSDPDGEKGEKGKPLAEDELAKVGKECGLCE